MKDNHSVGGESYKETIGTGDEFLDEDYLQETFKAEMEAIDRRYGIRNDSPTSEKKDIIMKAVDYIESQYKFASIIETGEIRYFQDGVYVAGGDALIESLAQAKFREDMNTHRIHEIKEHIRRDNLHKLEEFDANTEIINMENGLYNWKEDRLDKHDPQYLSMKQVPFPHIKNAKTERFGKFLKEVLYPREIRTAFELMAYDFYREHRWELYTVLVGIGANGKSVFTGVITKLHGEKNVSNVPLKTMIDRPFGLAALEGKDVNIDTELTSASIIDLSILKRLTGRQPIQIEDKQVKAHDVRLHAKLWFNANKIPQSMDESDGRYRREIIISFPNQFEGKSADPELLDKLTTKEELSGIFNVLMIALRRIMKEKEIHINAATIQERKEKYELLQNPIGRFIQDYVELDIENGVLPKEALYTEYKVWCKKHGLPVEKYDAFCKTLKDKYQWTDDREGTGGRRRVWIGRRLRQLASLTS